MQKKAIYIILYLSLMPGISVKLFSQEVTMISPYFQLQYFKNTDDQSFLQATLTYSKNRMELPLPGMEISFSNGGKLIGSVPTDNKGIARLELKDDIKPEADRNGLWPFSSEFKGNDTIEASASEITIREAKVKMVLSEIDSIKTIKINAFILDNDTEKPVPGEVFYVYVPRMFSLLPVGELTLDDAGEASLEFPDDLPGDKDGNITIIARFEENMTFGNIEKRETIKWGLPVHYSVPVSHRALWTKTAPRWMIYTLTILLAGVWGHYLFAFISLLRIKKNAKKEGKTETDLFIK